MNIAGLGSGLHANAAFPEQPLQLFGDFFVFHRNDALQHFIDGNLGAETMETGSEFDAHGTRAEDRERLGDVRQIEDFNVGQDAPGVRLQAGEHAGFRAGGEHNIPGFDDLLAAGRGDFDLAGTRQAAVTLDDVHLVFLHQELDALGMLGDDFILAVEYQREIQTWIFAMNSFFDGMLETVPNIGRVEEGFGGNAADVQAAAAQLGVFLNNGCFQAILARPNGRRVSPRTAP